MNGRSYLPSVKSVLGYVHAIHFGPPATSTGLFHRPLPPATSTGLCHRFICHYSICHFVPTFYFQCRAEDHPVVDLKRTDKFKSKSGGGGRVEEGGTSPRKLLTFSTSDDCLQNNV